MAATCNYDSILQAIVSAISGLGLTLNGATIPVTYLAEPSARDWNTLPKIDVCPSGGGTWERLFGQTYWVPYGVQVSLLMVGNQDLATNTSAQIGLRAKLQRLLGEPGNIGTSVRSVQVHEDAPIDRSQIPENYSISRKD